MEEAAVFKNRAIKVVDAQVKPLKIVKLEEAVVCKERTVKAAATKIDANYMTSHLVATDSLP